MIGFIFRNIAILVAWAAVFAMARFIGHVLGLDDFHWYAMGWLVIGMLVLTLRGVKFPEPSANKVDVVGALKMFWWMAWWPRFLRK